MIDAISCFFSSFFNYKKLWLKYYPITIKKEYGVYVLIQGPNYIWKVSSSWYLKKKNHFYLHFCFCVWNIYISDFLIFHNIYNVSYKIGFWVLRPLRCSWSCFDWIVHDDEWCVKRKTQNPCYTRNPYKFNKPMYWLITNIPGKQIFSISSMQFL